ncbi:unnamed protein product [Haemonchus placei]|uniref:Secreted protein n=1 Tax=Haemonchus placei TaxID=6290 RepID=A0A0N4WB85_HAEPC|nr:unnamed protein product [Haemonchus placei]
MTSCSINNLMPSSFSDFCNLVSLKINRYRQRLRSAVVSAAALWWWWRSARTLAHTTTTTTTGHLSTPHICAQLFRSFCWSHLYPHDHHQHSSFRTGIVTGNVRG